MNLPVGLSGLVIVVLAACGSSTSGIDATPRPDADELTPLVVATGSPSTDVAVGVNAHIRVISCDTFVPDVVPDDLGPVVSRLPDQILTDWVSYSDQFSIFTVLDEKEQSEFVVRSIAGGTFAYDRSVTGRIEETIWIAPGTQPIKGDITMVVSGWSQPYPGDFRFPAGGPGRLEVGGRYMAPLVLYKYDAGTAWGIIERSSLILDGDIVVGPSERSGIAQMPVVKLRLGQTVDEVATALACTEREARAVKYSDLLPEARWHAVQEDILENTSFDDPVRERLPDIR